MSTNTYYLWDNQDNSYDVAIELPDGYYWNPTQVAASRFQTAAVEFSGFGLTGDSSKALCLIDLATGRVLASTTLGARQFLVNATDADTGFQVGEVSNGVLVLKSYDYSLAATALNLARPTATVTITPPAGVTWSSYVSYEYAGTLGSGGYLLVKSGGSSPYALYSLATGPTTLQAAKIDLPPGTYDGTGSPFVFDDKLWLQTTSGESGSATWSQALYRFDGSSWTVVDSDQFWRAHDSAVGYQSVIRDGQSAVDLLGLSWSVTPDHFHQDQQAVRLPDGNLLVRVTAGFSGEALDVGFERWLVVENGQVVADQAFSSATGLGLRSLQSMDDGYAYFQQVDATFTGSAGSVTALTQSVDGVTIYKIALDQVASVLAQASDGRLAGASGVIEVARYSQAQLPATAAEGQLEIVKGYLPASLLVAGDAGAFVWSACQDPRTGDEVQYFSRIEADGQVAKSTLLAGDIIDVRFDGAWCALVVDPGNGVEKYYALNADTGGLTLIDAVQQGGAAADTMSGSTGRDLLLAGAGNDNLSGGAGNDTLIGGAGNDTLIGGAGNDVLDGGAGADDWASYAAAPGAVQVDLSLSQDQAQGKDGTDQIAAVEHVLGSRFNDSLKGNAADNFLQGGLGNDTLNGGAGYDWADYCNATGSVTVNLSLSSDQATGADGTDQLIGIERIRGGNQADRLTGDAGDNWLRGMQGNDTLDGGAGSDWADYRNASGAVTVNLSLASNQATGADGTDQLTGIENLRGGDYADRLTGDAGGNFLNGMRGNDTLDGGAGYDWADYSNAAAAVTVNLSLASNQATGADGTDQLISIENLRGSGYGDKLTGDGGENYLQGGAGNDTLDGGAGDDWADYSNAAASVMVNLSLGSDQATGADGTDQLISIENLRGSGYGDQLTGDAAENFLRGGRGNDTLDGGAGYDWADYWNAIASVTVNLSLASNQATGADGIDQLLSIERIRGSNHADRLTGDAGDNWLRGMQGNDTLDGADGYDWADYWNAIASVTVNLSLASDQATGADGTDQLTGIEAVRGGDFNDSLTGDDAANRLNGGAGNDTLTGGAGDDVLVGGAGNADEAWFTGAAADYLITQTGTGWWVADQRTGSPDGSDTLTGIEILRFAGNSMPTGQVTISGTATQGQRLTAAHALADADGLGTIAYQWLADGVAISGATASTLTLAQAQVGKTISVKASYTDLLGTPESVSSSATVRVANVNDVPQGRVTISGTATQGQRLTAAHTLTDADGLGAITYQWYADDVAVSGATAATFTLAQSQVGKAISVKASYTDLLGTAETRTSAATANVASVNDAGVVKISGTPQQGVVLKAAVSDADGVPATGLSYQWLADGVAISGATASTLTLAQSQVGKAISVKASYTDLLGTPESVSSSATVRVANVNDVPQGQVTISGALTQGQKLTAAHTLADADGLGTIAYQWLANGVAISGATASTLTLAQAQVGQVISVRASYTDKLGTAESMTSSATTAVANVEDEATGTLAVAGTIAEGGTLTAALSDLTDADGMTTTSWQWQSSNDGSTGWSDLVNQTSAHYTIASDQSQVGQYLRVIASTTDVLGGSTCFTSAASRIANVNDAVSGDVTISGTAQQGQTLKASNTLADADGLGTISYQWLRAGKAISGATATSYTLTASDVGQSVSVRASYTDGGSTTERVTSAATPAVSALPGVVFGDVTGLVTTEASGTDSFTVALRAAPRHDVTLTFTVSDATEAVFAATSKATHSITFTAANWAKAQTVVLRGVDDKSNDGDVAYTISTSVSSSDLRYDGMRSGSGLPIANLVAQTTDNDVPDKQYGDGGGIVTDDLIQGGNGASDLYGLLGRDEIYGNNGDDRLYGGYEDDVLYGNADDDELEGDQGNDKLDGGTGHDTLNGGTGNDSLYGQAGNDNLLGEAGKDSLVGGAGNDTLNGGVDADNMDGGNGSDVYYIDNAADVVRDSGTDTAVDTVYIMAYLSGGITLGAGIDNGALNDLAGKGSLTGNTGNNALTGNASENVIFGGEGTDTLSGGAGGDTLDGGAGIDSLDGGAGSDSLSGGLGDDVLYSGDGDDVVDGGDGSDLIIGGDGAGNDKYNGGAGIDTVKYTSATAGITVDLVKGSATSTAGNDAARIGNDSLSNIENVIAGNYNDMVKGSTLANVLTGGLGSDSLYGGMDKVKDIFDFNAIAESKTGSARDKVYDFVSKIDKVDLSGIDASTAKTGDQAFAFSGSTAKANAVWYKVADVDGNATAKDIIVYGDVTGDAKADFEIGLVGVTAVAAADFVL